MKVAILGASNKPDRYGYKALRRLLEYGHEVFPVHPTVDQIEGIPTYRSVDALPKGLDTLTVYVNSRVSSELAEKIVLLSPRRIIFNPGTENQELAKLLESKGIIVQEACTLVLLRTGQF
jgi:uncharacterized protein